VKTGPKKIDLLHWHWRVFICSLFIYLFSLGGLASSAAAAPKQQNPPTISQYVYKQLNSAQQQLNAGAPDKALLTLDNILTQRSSSPYEKALAQQTSGLIYYQQQKIDQAIKQFKLAIDSHALPLPAEQQSRYNLAQLYLSEQHYSASIKTMTLWFQLSEKPSGQAYLLLASAYAANHQYQEAIKPAQLAIETFSETTESHYRFLLGLYFETEDHPQATALLEKLILKFPNTKEYWLQLASLYAQNNREQDSLAIIEMAYQRLLLNRSEEIVQLSQRLLQLQNPYKAAQILEREMEAGRVEPSVKNHELLASAWFNAREYQKALAPLKSAAEQSSDGQIHFRLAQAQFELEQYRNAIKNLKLAQHKGSLKQPGAAYLLDGIAHYQLEMPELAARAFEKALQFDATHDQASRWINYLKQD
jgi:tetratricopeptide (TPR) repeat protein